ncbi:MBL fold metallo-hydrolase [Thalassoglobus polymorphus]|uniref:Putative polyketide biosynthesis zinc-dependent hydrolase BaeB n=1 Tax=Thalassoglobus polymorphus TaxID=2527994 RepID=A0A517QLE5_9PLAN|nr:MBL fold metallo-hydrolase [Thalassoglobus polymorphus]QDT32367.1 putative polyketide biosynthesis zinc-dependent hydrolase BaeB [Thalassoglobus polymorphus]
MFVLETVLTDGIAQLSYFVGDTETGRAAVIDPRTDVEIYEELARKHGVSITHIFETHIHADFVSGSLSLSARLGTAEIWLSGENAGYQFPGNVISDGETFDFGGFLLVARHTPGHTPEHLSFEICEAKNPDRPFAIFTGDSLFVGSAGRPDLLGGDQTEALSEDLYRTLYDYYLKLDDFVTIYPGHGAGSACGADIGDRLCSTIGYERRTNAFLKFPDLQTFQEFVINDAPPVPWHYPELKKVNASGPEVMDRLPTIRALPPDKFRKVMREAGVVILDTRSMLAFGGGHVSGAINIGDRPEMSAWVGQLFDLDQRLLLIVDDDKEVEQVQRLIVRTGHSRFAGYLAGGMKAWEVAGLPMESTRQVTVEELREMQISEGDFTLLDVRSPAEWESGRIPGAQHQFIADMRDRISGLDKAGRYITYCASGYRASIASSLMQSRGFSDVSNVPGSWGAWKAVGYDIEKPEEATV